jgi:hypothetical protein
MKIPPLLFFASFVLLVVAAGPRAAKAGPQYSSGLNGNVAGYRLAGVEPDGDPLYQVVLQTRLSAQRQVPALNLIVSSYYENFRPDTTPILPDLLNPKDVAKNLGGFLQGKVLLTDDAGDVLYLGSFLAEAFFDNSNHTVMNMDGSGSAAGVTASLKGAFTLHKDGSLHGALSGRLRLPTAALRQVRQHRGEKMKPLKQIISLVTVRPAPMRGRATNGSTGAPLRTGFGSQSGNGVLSSSSRHVSPWTIAAASCAVVSFLISGVLFWRGRR